MDLNDTAERSIAEECEAFLAGTYAAWLTEHRRAVPSWAHLNKLGHGDAVELVDLAVAGVSNGALLGPWDRVAAGLASEMLVISDGDVRRLEALQHDVITKLELDLAAVGCEHLCPRTVLELGVAVLRAARPGTA